MNNTKVMATVNGKDITEQDVNFLMESLGPQQAAQFNSAEGRKTLLNELINQELFYLDAKKAGLNEEEEFKRQLEKTEENLLKQYAIRKLLADIKISEGEILDYYNKNKSQFQQPEKLRATHILVDDEDKAKNIINELANGLSFEDAAKEYSSCPSKSKGGDLGYFEKGKMVPEFEDAAFELNVGDTSAPVQTQFGYHIIHVTDKQAPSVSPLDDVKGQIANMLLGMKQNELYLGKTEELKKEYTVQINE